MSVQFVFLMNGCSIDALIVWAEINKVQVIKQNTYIKHCRAYFHRSHLQSIFHLVVYQAILVILKIVKD